MMILARCSFTLLVIAAAASVAAADKPIENKLPDAVVKALEKADAVELYSLTGERAEKEPGWRGWKSLGSTTIKKAAEKKALAATVAKGVADGDAGARCFIPRHGITAKHDGKTYSLVICFECHWVYVYTDATDRPMVYMTTDVPQKALNKILTDANVKLAKPEKDKGEKK